MKKIIEFPIALAFTVFVVIALGPVADLLGVIDEWKFDLH